MEGRQRGCERCQKWKGRKGGAQQHQERCCNMKWRTGRLIRISAREIRGAGCKEIVTKSDWEAALCTSLLSLKPCCIYPWIQFLWCNRVLTLGGASGRKRVFTRTRKELRTFHSLPFSAGAGVRWLPLASGNGSGTVGLFGSFPPTEITEAQRLYSM